MPSSRPRRSASSRSCRRVSDLPGVAARRIRRAALRGALVAFGAAVLVVVVALATDRTKMLPWAGFGLFAGLFLAPLMWLELLAAERLERRSARVRAAVGLSVLAVALLVLAGFQALYAGTMLVSQSSDRAWSEVAKLASEFQRRPGRAALLALAIAAPLGLSAWSR